MRCAPLLLPTVLLQLCFHDLHHRLLPNIHRRARCARLRHVCRRRPSREFSCFFHALQPLISEQALFPYLLMWLSTTNTKLASLRAPPFHWPCAAAAAAAALLLPRNPRIAKGTKKE
jgi:hypothetical protein